MDTPAAPFFHSTFFKLPTGCADVRQAYMDACAEYLSTSPGMLSFWVGARAQDMQRPVNDVAFDVAMNQVFRDKSWFDVYNGHDPRHEQFVEVVNKLAPGTTRRVCDASADWLSYTAGSGLTAKQAAAEPGGAPRMMHSIYFQLIERTPANQAALMDICMEHLSNHPGISAFSLGTLIDLKRDVSQNNYDVAMSILWKSKHWYDTYLASPEHEEFFPPATPLLKSTFVFDSYLRPDAPAPAPATAPQA
jgi:hypothetical protein